MSTQRKETTPSAGPSPPSRKSKWRVLERLVEELSAADLSTEWVRPEPRIVVRDGVEQKIHQFPYPQYAPQVIAAEAALYDMGLIVDFDWPSWSESQRYFDGEPVEDEVVAVKFLTAVVRAERFSEGVLDRAVETGVFAGALRVLCGGSGRRSITRSSRFRGCLLGGAVGDALGAPVEFTSLSTILDRYGPDGITDYSPAFGRLGAITDDTQMTLFTAEGLLVCSGPSGGRSGGRDQPRLPAVARHPDRRIRRRTRRSCGRLAARRGLPPQPSSSGQHLPVGTPSGAAWARPAGR